MSPSTSFYNIFSLFLLLFTLILSLFFFSSINSASVKRNQGDEDLTTKAKNGYNYSTEQKTEKSFNINFFVLFGIIICFFSTVLIVGMLLFFCYILPPDEKAALAEQQKANCRKKAIDCENLDEWDDVDNYGGRRNGLQKMTENEEEEEDDDDEPIVPIIGASKS